MERERRGEEIGHMMREKEGVYFFVVVCVFGVRACVHVCVCVCAGVC